jgi:lipoprotein-anchoring transpeptidase ErfK/SrfK
MKTMPYIQTGLRAAALALLTGTLAGCGTLDLPGLRGTQWAAAPPEPTTQPTAAEEEPTPPPPEKPKPGQLYDWEGDGRKVSRVVIDVDQQRARFYDGDEQIGWATVATGVKAFPTPTGQFEVIEKVADKRSNLYGKIYNKAGRVIKSNARQGRDRIPEGGRFAGAQMPYFMRLTYDGVGLHAGPIPRPGHPASHGCIRLPPNLAPVLFAHVDHGTPVTIVGSGPSYGDYVEKMRIAAARERATRERAAAERAAAEEASATPPMTLAAGEPGTSPTAATSRESGPSATAPVQTTEPPTAPSAGDERVIPPATEPDGAAQVAAEATPEANTQPETTSVAPASPSAAAPPPPEGEQPPVVTPPVLPPVATGEAPEYPRIQDALVPPLAIPALPGAVERYGP